MCLWCNQQNKEDVKENNFMGTSPFPRKIYIYTHTYLQVWESAQTLWVLVCIQMALVTQGAFKASHRD